MEKIYRILTINPGSTSTKVGVFENDTQICEVVTRHSKEELDKFDSNIAQKGMRLELVVKALEEKNIKLDEIDAFVGRGGIVAPLESGVYAVGEKLLYDLEHSQAQYHASCLGGLIAHELGEKYGKPSFIVDPVVVNERIPYMNLSGLPQCERACVWHALNHKAIARKCAQDMGKKYEDCRFVIAHMGGGVSVAAHANGRAIDVQDGFNGEGSFSPERCGAIQVHSLVTMCFSGKYTEAEMNAFANKNGGIAAHLGTKDFMEVERRVLAGEEKATMVFNAMAAQLSKDIGAMAAMLEGDVDAVVLTGGLAYSKPFVELITKRVKFIAPVKVYAGEDELRALAQGGLRVLRGEEQAKEYKG